MKLFQFLIGRLQTLKRYCPLYRDPLFQFLIGRLQTVKCVSVNFLVVLFQFLIGRLQTLHPQFYFSFLSRVSIPYRQATNGHKTPLQQPAQDCFNSLQVGYKRLAHLSSLWYSSSVSIPYRQATNVRLGLKCWNYRKAVSIPYRQATNLLEIVEEEA